MTTTPNLHLPQWEASDRIHHDDFNAAMASIDAALAQKADSASVTALETDVATRSRFVKLKEVHHTGAVTSYTLPLSDIDWGAWQNVHFDINSHNSSSGYIYLNTVKGGNQLLDLRTSDKYTENGMEHHVPKPRLTLTPGKCADRFVSGSYLAYSITNTSIRFSTLTSFVFSDCSFNGMDIVIWGEA